MSTTVTEPRTRRSNTAREDKDLVARLADAGEEALQRLAELPGGQRAVGAFNDLRNRVDDLGKRVRGVEKLEERVSKLEKEVATLRKGKTPERRSAPRKPAP